jgi:hypothetical protein
MANGSILAFPLESTARSNPDVSASRSRRYRYTRLSRPCSRVIVDIDREGREDWAEQAPEEIRWYPFTPSKAERTMLRRWQKTGRPPMRGAFVGLLS